MKCVACSDASLSWTNSCVLDHTEEKGESRYKKQDFTIPDEEK